MVEIQYLVKKGQSLLEDGKFIEALGFFEQALLLNQDDPDLWNSKGIVLRRRKQWNALTNHYKLILEINKHLDFV